MNAEIVEEQFGFQGEKTRRTRDAVGLFRAIGERCIEYKEGYVTSLEKAFD